MFLHRTKAGRRCHTVEWRYWSRDNVTYLA